MGASESRSSASNQSSSSEPPRKSPPRSAPSAPTRTTSCPIECQPLSRTVVNEEAILNNLLSSSTLSEPSLKTSSSDEYLPPSRRFPHFPHGAFLLEERRVRLPHPVAENKSDDGCHVFQPALVPELDTVAENKSDDGKLTDGRHVLKRALDTYEIESDIQRLNEKIKEKKKTSEELERRVRRSDLRNIGLQPLRHSQSLMFLPPQMAENKSDDGKVTHGCHVFKRAPDTYEIESDIQRLNEKIKGKKKTTEELERRVRWSDLRFFGRWSYLVKIQRLKENIKELKKTSEALERRVRWSDLNEIESDIQRLNEKIKELKKTTEELERRVRWSDLRNIGLQPLRHSQSLMFLPPQMAENKSDDGKLTDGCHVFKRALDTFKIQRLKENIKELKKTSEALVAENKSDVGKVTHGRALVPELDTGILPDKYQEDAGKPAEMTVTLKYPELTAAAMAAIVGAEAAAAA